MSDAASGIFVASTPAASFVRVVGRGVFRNSQPLRQFGQRVLQDGCKHICVDLAQCPGMDSTFLGVLAGFGLALRQSGSLSVLHVSERNLQALLSVGLDRLARLDPVNPDPLVLSPPDDIEFHKLPGSDLQAPSQGADTQETAQVMLECHEDLCRADERNEAKFKDVKQFLREDIARRSEKKKDAQQS